MQSGNYQSPRSKVPCKGLPKTQVCTELQSAQQVPFRVLPGKAWQMAASEKLRTAVRVVAVVAGVAAACVAIVARRVASVAAIAVVAVIVAGAALHTTCVYQQLSAGRQRVCEHTEWWELLWAGGRVCPKWAEGSPRTHTRPAH